MKRRTFNRLAATSSLAGIFPNHRMETPTRKLGVALVGLGNYATHQLAPALQHSLNCKLVGIVTGTPSKVPTWIEKYSLRRSNVYNYDSYDAIKENQDIDIVYVVLPNSMHHEYTIRALQAGKHVICEKPMAISALQAQEMVDVARDQNRKLQVGYRLYFEPHHLALQEMVRKHNVNDLRLMEASLGFDMARHGLWRIDKKLGGGGALMDLGLYCIQAARRTKGSLPVKIRATGQTIRKDLFKDIYENVFWQLEFADGMVCNSSTSYSTYVDRLYASQKSRWFELNPAFNATGAQLRTHDGDKVLENPPFQQTAQMDEFAQCIREDRESIAHGGEGVIDMKIIEAIFRSADHREEIALQW